MERAEEAVSDEAETPKSVASSSMDAVPESSVAQKAVADFHTFLVESEDSDDVFLPMDDEELTKFARSLEKSETVSREQEQQRSRYVHLESLSTKLYHGVYQRSLVKMKQIGQSMKEFFSQLQQAIDLIDWSKESVEKNLSNAQEKQKQLWLEWSRKQPGRNEDLESAQPEEIESCALAAVCSTIQFLKDMCLGLMPGIHSLPDDIKEQVHQIKNHIEDVHASFSAATSFHSLSSNALFQSRERVARGKECLDVLLEYLIQNIPLKRHVGVFIPSESSLEEEEEG
ncbi:perilipin-3-like [Apteryx rowi]|uniref:perilipin-3-like n=1 Tax=Apteryx rowi TaxID=308060 RepID=UPI000E1DDDF3|nr:perilipin-3-like [Apteryx rowi]